MNILIIGGSGFVSGTLAELAVADGHQVWAVTRGHRALPDGVQPIIVDRKDRAGFAAAVANVDQRWDLVVDCIGFEPADAEQDVAAFRDRAKHLVFISTDFVYDPSQRTHPQTEENRHFLRDDSYGAKKRLCEEVLLSSDSGKMQWTVLRPCHIYGPRSLLGCLPLHGRDPELIDKLRAEQSLQLVGGGHFLQQPILAADLARMILSCADNSQTFGQIYQAAGPDIVESRAFYQIIADILDVPLTVEEVSVPAFFAENPGCAPFLCHRIYDLTKAQNHGLAVPSTSLAEGLRQHVASLLE